MGKKLLLSGFALGIFLFGVGFVGVLTSDKLIQGLVKSAAKLVPGSELFQQWVDPPIEVYINFNLFNVKNGPDFDNGAKPIFEEIGPIVYREYVKKENITDNKNGTITYIERKYYVFDAEKSAYPEDYKITTLNMAAITIIDQLKNLPVNTIVHDIIDFVLNPAFSLTGETLLITKTIREIMFGYEDVFLKTVKDGLKRLNLNSSIIPTDIIGLFIGKNNSIDGLYTIYTGEDDYKKLGIVQSFNMQDKMSTWTTKYANMINGTDGTLIAPFVTEDQIIYIFVDDLCRSLYLVYSDTISTYHDIKLLGFSTELKFFANASVNPDNGGFCTPAGNCLPAGVLNLTVCLGGIPIIQSSPHFLFCDEKYLSQVEGLKPDINKHRTQLYVEPTSGVLMKANKRIQFNTQLPLDQRITITKNLSECLFPLMWIDENFIIDEVNANKFYNQLVIPQIVLNVGKYVILAVGAILIIFLEVFYFRTSRKNHDYQPINTPEESEEINRDYDETTNILN